jgi:uncharacterized RDD family membrane protein YckC/Tfp pilus assembly protein PilE
MYCTQCGYNNPASARFCKNCELDLQAGAIDADRAVKPEILIYAGFWVRLAAAFLDVLAIAAVVILLVFSIAVLVALTGRDDILHNQQAISIFYWTVICMSAAYYILMESGEHGATFGKRWVNIKVLDAKGDRLSIARALARFLARLFSYLLLLGGFLIQPFTQRKQALHDLLAGTVVVRANDSNKVSIMASLLVLFFALMVPVLAIFSTVGVPLFQQYILKVQLNHAVQTGKEATLAVAHFYRNNGKVPATISDAANISLTSHVAGIAINQQNGEVTLTFSESVRKALRNKTLLFTPTLQADHSISWQCHSNDIEARLLPDTCK